MAQIPFRVTINDTSSLLHDQVRYSLIRYTHIIRQMVTSRFECHFNMNKNLPFHSKTKMEKRKTMKVSSVNMQAVVEIAKRVTVIAKITKEILRQQQAGPVITKFLRIGSYVCRK